MYKNVLVFYSRLPINSVDGKTRIGNEINNQQLASRFNRALINDMLAEYNPFLEDEYDLVFYYDGDLSEFRTRYKYNIRRYVRAFSNDVKVGMTHIHGRMAQEYEKVIIVGSDIPLLTKSVIKNAFAQLGTYKSVMVPVDDGGYGLFGATEYVDIYDKVTNYNSRSEGYNLAEETRVELKKQNISLYNYDSLFDVDSVADIQRLYKEITKNHALKPEYFYLQRTFEILERQRKEFNI